MNILLPDERQLHSSPAPVRITATSLHQFFDISPDALLVIDPAGTIMMVNEQTEALFGFAHSELLSQQLEILLPERFRDAHIAHREQFFSAPRTRQMGAGLQLSGKRKDGTEFPVDISLRPLLIDEAFHVMAAVRDMTEQKRMEEERAKRPEDEQYLRILNMILSARSEFVFLFDRHGRHRFVSESAATLFGLQQSDFLGKTWQELGLPAEYTESFEVNRRKVMVTGRAVTEEILYPVVNGMRWFEYVAKPVVDQDGEVTSLVVSSQDITERKQGEDALHRLASIVESSGDTIYSKTLEGVITSWNSSAEKLLGYTADEIIGKSISLIIPPDRQEELPEILARITAGETVQHHETTRMRKDGTYIEVSVTVSPIRDPKGRIIAASTITHDITEQKRMIEELATRSRELEGSNEELATRTHELERSVEELATRSRELERSLEELIALNSALEEANRARGQFLSTMSHELRTPLASIIGFTQMLLDDADIATLNQQQHHDLQRILKNGQHLLGLINDVLDLTKIEAGRMVVNYSQVDVRDLLTSVVEETQSIAIARQLVLRAEVEQGIAFLESNSLKLRQVLLNLVSNALKFTEQGEVTVSARRVLSPDQEGERVALAVTDSGIGIPADIQAHVFEAFYQADGTYTRKAGGTGLGLSIVSQLTTLLGGTIAVTSAPGQGSTFTVMLPLKALPHSIEQNPPRLHLAQPLEATRIPPASGDLTPAMSDEFVAVSAHRGATEGQNQLILAVDDNPDVIVLIKAALKDTPYTVVGLQDPLQAMELVQELHPCAILLDVMMPDLNGWQLLNQLKVNPATASIPVMMITVLTEPTTGYVLGADAYLIKPFKTTVLLNTLRDLLTSQTGPSPAAEREAQRV